MKVTAAFVIHLILISGISIAQPGNSDWLLDGRAYRAEIKKEDENHIVLENGLIRREFILDPAAATIVLENLVTGNSVIRGIKPEAELVINGDTVYAGGLEGQPNLAFLDPDWIKDMKPAPGSFRYEGYEAGPIEARMEWKRVRHAAPDAVWPPKGVHLAMRYSHPGRFNGVIVKVHYNLYDGIPAYSKWIEVYNGGKEPIMLDAFTSEKLAAVEAESWVESRGVEMPKPNIQVATDYQFGGMTPANVTNSSVFWESDPDYHTQVGYTKQTPCLLKVKPIIGPALEIVPGNRFESFRTWVLVNDSYDKERNSLAYRKLNRIIAPWVTENPLMMHIRFSDDEAVKIALDQCAEVGFEMAIMTFGSGFNIEDTSKENISKWKKWADYAHSKGLELGGYSLLSSRRISEKDDVINPETGKRGGVIHGNAPCLGSEWGINYMKTLYRFYRETGMNLLEHDGSYPGHVCASVTHPDHKGVDDSQWKQWRSITDFYKWCRSEGIYLNVPDWFYLSGSNKNGMGYREVNWSLPREQQVIHTRQNIFDGTWYKTPSMGWMFVPLTEYHGGGATATIEPLNQHLDHYQKMLAGNLANGVQACYRGPRLYDSPKTRELVKKWVGFYKEHRDILESDVIHSTSRRADDRDLDWIFHANAQLEEKGYAMVFNPTNKKIEKKIRLNLYYSGLKDIAKVKIGDGEVMTFNIDRNYNIFVPVNLEGGGYVGILIQ